MKAKVKSLIIVLVLAAPIYYGWTLYKPKIDEGRELPKSTRILNQLEKEGFSNFTVKDIHGDSFSLFDYKGKVIILNFWASWCEPCVQEFPSMIELINKFEGEVVMLALSHDRNYEDLENFLKAFDALSKKNINLRVVWDKDREIAKKLYVQALPETFLINKDLKLIRKIIGSENWATPEAIAYFSSMLNN